LANEGKAVVQKDKNWLNCISHPHRDPHPHPHPRPKESEGRSGVNKAREPVCQIVFALAQETNIRQFTKQ